MENHEVYEEDGTRYLSGKPKFDVYLKRSHVEPRCLLRIPNKIADELPRSTVPVVLRYDYKNWKVFYLGDCNAPQFDVEGWKEFVVDNKLKMDDACVFEVMDKENIRFKVHILRGDPEETSEDSSVGNVENPIELD